ncbi:MAG: SRPBCC domain-containing protein [Flavobacteriaceae bacterium]
METLNFHSFTKKIYIKAPLEKLYHCWASSEGLCSWFLREAIFNDKEGTARSFSEYIQAGDSYTWRWHNWDGKEEGVVLEANGIDRLEITFAGKTKVKVKLIPEKGSVLVVLKQYHIPTDEESKLNIHVGCSNGWTFWLANLKAYLEHGILLHEKEIDLRDVPMAAFEFVNL